MVKLLTLSREKRGAFHHQRDCKRWKLLTKKGVSTEACALVVGGPRRELRMDDNGTMMKAMTGTDGIARAELSKPTRWREQRDGALSRGKTREGTEGVDEAVKKSKGKRRRNDDPARVKIAGSMRAGSWPQGRTTTMTRRGR